MIIEEIIEKKPHLKEPLELYKKVLKFKELETKKRENMLSVGLSYSQEDIKETINGFSEIFNINSEDLKPLQDALLSGSIDLRKLPLGEAPLFSLPYKEGELLSFLYIISKPFFLTEKRKLNLDDIFWTEGKCHVCSSIPAVSFISKDEKRKFYCSFCETSGPWKRIGCPHCLTENQNDISIITLEGEEGMRADICEACKSYYKSFDSSLLTEYTPELLDLLSIPLDVVVQEKDFKRHAPNPLGLKQIS